MSVCASLGIICIQVKKSSPWVSEHLWIHMESTAHRGVKVLQITIRRGL